MDRRALETSRLSPGEQAKVVIQKLLHVQHLHNPSVPATTCNCLPNAKGFIPITRQLLILLVVPILLKCDWIFRCTSQLWLHFYVIMLKLYDKVLVKCLLGKGCVLQAMEVSAKYAVSGHVGIFSRPLISHSRRSLNIKTPVLPVAEGGSLQLR